MKHVVISKQLLLFSFFSYFHFILFMKITPVLSVGEVLDQYLRTPRIQLTNVTQN